MSAADGMGAPAPVPAPAGDKQQIRAQYPALLGAAHQPDSTRATRQRPSHLDTVATQLGAVVVAHRGGLHRRYRNTARARTTV